VTRFLAFGDASGPDGTETRSGKVYGEPFEQTPIVRTPLFEDCRRERQSPFGKLVFLSLSRVFRHPCDIDYHAWFVTYYPRVMSWRQQRYFAWSELVFTPVIHADLETPGDMVLQVTRLAAFGFYNWFYAR
jgi:hypothetical protein